MGHRLEGLLETEIEDAIVELLIKEHDSTVRPGLERLWSYYRNELEPVTPAAGPGRAYRLAQEAGLPRRVVGSDGLLDDRAAGRREVVVENDIAWRVHTMVDFMFGKPMRIVSTAREDEDRRRIERVLDAVWERSGGIALLQDMALLGHVYGFVDLVLRIDEAGLELAGAVARGDADADELVELAELFRIEVVEPTRGIPVIDESDYRKLRGYVIHFERELNDVEPTRFGGAERRRSSVTEVIERHGRRVVIDGQEVESDESRLLGGELPVAHIQNVSQPFRYPGLGEVEPLLALQDELNTRLSDRASRVTMQSFKMMLVRGLDPAAPFPVGPGQVWQTDNLDASIEAFGGDADSPSERAHVQEVREAMDKISGVPPLAAGVVRARIGNLSSANALRVTLMGLISRTARKRVTYGRGIERISGLVLRALDAAGVMGIGTIDRGIRLVWPDPLPVDVGEQVQAARAKADLGVPREQVLAELGVAPTDPGVT